MDNNRSLDRIYQFCYLLKNKCLAKEIKEYLKGYVVEETDKKNFHEINLKNELGHSINITFKNSYFSMLKTTDNTVEKTTIYPLTETISTNRPNPQILYPNILMRQRIIEKRPNGIIIRDIEKHYALSHRFNNQIVLADIRELRYTYTKETAEKTFKNLKFDKSSPMTYLLKSRQLEINNNTLEDYCNYSSNFESHMNYYDNGDVRHIKDNIYPHRTYLNGEEVTRLYDLIDGPDKIYRVYDLYRGVINPRNEQDIHSINLGLLSADSYDLITLKGIKEQENSLAGQSLEPTEEYHNYLKKFFNVKYGYQEEFNLDRDSILKVINYQMPVNEKVKKIVETKLGIPYEEYEKLDWQEQYKLIEEKTGQKVLPNYLLHLDGIPMDKDHMFTNEKANKAIDKITESTPKRLLRSIFKKRKR